MANLTFGDLLAMDVVRVSNDVDYRCFDYWHILPEDLRYNYDQDKLIESERVETKYIRETCFDGRRTWELGYTTFDGNVAFFFAGWGRDGIDGYKHRIYGDGSTYNNLVGYIKSLCPAETENFTDPNVCDDDQADGFTTFYGLKLSEVDSLI